MYEADKLKNFAPHLRLYTKNGRDYKIKKRFLIFLFYIQERTDLEENKTRLHVQWILRLRN
jgi:hypothetical protein